MWRPCSMRVNSEICFICNTPGADSRDHVIPRGLLVPPFPDNLLTLPAHHRCHNQLDEEYFRIIVAGLGLEKSTSAHVLWEDTISRSIHRSRPLWGAIRSALVPRINLLFPGGIWMETVPGLNIDRDRFYPTLGKIVRGLYHHHTGRYLPMDAAFDWAINEPPDGGRLNIFQSSNLSISYRGIFNCRYAIASDDTMEMTIWWLRFYRGLIMRCLTRSSYGR